MSGGSFLRQTSIGHFLVVTSLWLWRPIGSVISSHSSINSYKRKIVVVERSDDVISDIHKLSKIIWRWRF